MDPMMIRALNQRQNQAPMRFFEAGTHGQPYKERPEDVEAETTSTGRVHDSHTRADDEHTETNKGPRRADASQPNLGRGGRTRGEGRSDILARLAEDPDAELFDEDPEVLEDDSSWTSRQESQQERIDYEPDDIPITERLADKYYGKGTKGMWNDRRVYKG